MLLIRCQKNAIPGTLPVHHEHVLLRPINFTNIFQAKIIYREGIKVEGIFGLLILIADIWAIFNVVQSRSSIGKKILWVLLILVLPVAGVILWFFLGPKSSARR